MQRDEDPPSVPRQDLPTLAASEANRGVTKAVGRAHRAQRIRDVPEDLPTLAASEANRGVTKNCRACPTRVARWRARQDLNLRPTDSKSGALSN